MTDLPATLPALRRVLRLPSRWTVPGLLLLALGAATAATVAAATPPPGRVISVLRSFEPGEDPRWSGGPSSGGHADFSATDGIRGYSSDTPYGTRCWRLDATDPVPFSGWKKAGWDKIDKIFLVGLLKIPHFPPEADVVRLRAKVLQGRFVLSVGGPVIQSGTSDVFARPIEVTAENCAEWRTLDFSLNHELLRNFRRARYSKDSPVIYQTRWGQEDFCVVGLQPSVGILLIDQIELVALGEGKPFPQFAAADVQLVRTIADFEAEDERRKAATVLHGYDGGQGQADTMAQSWLREPDRPNVARWRDKAQRRLAHEPVRFTFTAGAAPGRRALAARAHFEEEHSFGLIKTDGEPKANALRIVVRAKGKNGDLPSDPRLHWGLAVDFLALVAPAGRPLPWEALGATAEQRRGPGPGYDYEISLARTAGVSYGYYHARRLLREGEWTTLIIPFADFACGYGQGDLAAAFREQRPLVPAQLAGLLFTGPIRFDMEIAIDEVAYVRVPGTAESLRSYWQTPAVAATRLEKNTLLRVPGVQIRPLAP